MRLTRLDSFSVRGCVSVNVVLRVRVSMRAVFVLLGLELVIAVIMIKILQTASHFLLMWATS